MKRIALVLTLSFLVSTGITAEAAVKVGASCNKAGATTINSGKKYTCIKSGKKLIWNKGVTISKVQINPPISNNQTQAAENNESCGIKIEAGISYICRRVNGKDVWEINNSDTAKKPDEKKVLIGNYEIAIQAFNSISSELGNRVNSGVGMELIVSPNFNKKHIELSEFAIKKAMDYWSDVFNPDYQVPVFYVDPRDKEWFNENFQKRVTSKLYLDQFNNLYSYYTTNFGAGDADKDYVTNKNFIVFVYTHDYKANFGSIQIGAHEYTHDVQHSFDIWRTNEQLPCWVKEGQAMFFGLALSKSNLEDYLDLRYRFFQNTPEARTSLPQDPTNWVEFFTKGEANKHDCAAGGVYEAGALANEYLYSLKGKKGVVDLWKALETAPDFNTALKLAYGEDTSTLYPAFGRYIDSQLLELRKNINYR